MGVGDVDLPDGAADHLCGSLPFMPVVRGGLIDKGVPARDVRYELFGPDLRQADLQIESVTGQIELGRRSRFALFTASG
jgi:nitric oxide dioxygenase